MIVGIDLGTTHSLIGIYDEDGRNPRLVPNALGEYLTPSVVHVDRDGHVVVGRAARDRLVTDPLSTAANFKRWMGSSRETRLGRKSFRPEELSAMVLRSLVSDAEAHLGQKIGEAVISVPAYFGDAQRKATKAAGELAGLRVERLINEPTAAALAYGLQARIDGSTFIVLDLGGGTFDVSILEIFDGVMQVHASAGDNHLGGEDFLRALVAGCCGDLGIKADKLPGEEYAHLLNRLERAKQELSQRREVEVPLVLGGRNLSWTLSEERFESLSAALVQRLRHPVEQAMRDASLQSSQLDEIVLVGGASRMPLVSRLVARMLGRLPMRHIDPDKAVAMGACIAAGMKSRNASLEEIVLTDVCPYTLGVEVSRPGPDGKPMTGFFSPVLERNCTVPASRVESYHPVDRGQSQIELNVYQGESPMVANNVRLGQLTVAIPPRLEPHENRIEVRFTYDVNGVLQVEATTVATQSRHELIIQKNDGVLTEREIRERLAALDAIKVHPRDDQQNIAVIAHAERLYAESLGAARDQLAHWLAQFMGELERQDPVSIAKHRKHLMQALDEFETGMR